HNYGTFEKRGEGYGLVEAWLEIHREEWPGVAVGELLVGNGTLEIGGPLLNSGDMTIGSTATVHFDGTIHNLAEGILILRGDATGSGSLMNPGTATKDNLGPSEFQPWFYNIFDHETGERGVLEILGGTGTLANVSNSGTVFTDAGASLIITTSFTNWWHGVISGEGNFDVSGATFLNYGSGSPGTSPGSLNFLGNYTAETTSRLYVELGGHVAGDDYDQVNVSGSATYGGALHVSLINGFEPDEFDTFTVFTTGGKSPAGGRGGFDCYTGLQLDSGLYLEPVVEEHSFLLVAKNIPVSNTPPEAFRDTYATDQATTITLTPLANDKDKDKDDLSLVSLATAGTQGVAYIDSNSTTITFIPSMSYAGEDSFVYTVGDCMGATDTAMVVIDVADLTAVDQGETASAEFRLHPNYPNPFNPQTRISFDLPVAGHATVVIYDIRGRRIRTLTDSFQEAGTVTLDWFGRDDRGRKVPSGVYFVQLAAQHQVATHKLVLLR
ncbi:MAG: cadherin-like domain-containing protein, partial [bacterium]